VDQARRRPSTVPSHTPSDHLLGFKALSPSSPLLSLSSPSFKLTSVTFKFTGSQRSSPQAFKPSKLFPRKSRSRSGICAVTLQVTSSLHIPPNRKPARLRKPPCMVKSTQCTVNVVLCTCLALMVSTSLFTCFFSPASQYVLARRFSSNIRTANSGI
ncbi:hypothetical protein B0H14DRAFT_2766031, partial [Mycena olivaceomarginata]